MFFNFFVGDICLVGYYCFRGLVCFFFCKFGQYCLYVVLVEFEGNCIEGYYCNDSLIVLDQFDCLIGYYCLLGMGILVFCFQGIFFDMIRNMKFVDCRDCIVGSYCVGMGNFVLIRECVVNYYCFGG